MATGIGQGDVVEISAEGEDEMLAVETLVALIGSGFWRSVIIIDVKKHREVF